VTVGPIAMSDNDVHDLALSDDNMDNTTNNNDEAVPVTEPVTAPVVTVEAVTGVVTEEDALSDDSASGAEAVTGVVTEEDALSDDSASGVVAEEVEAVTGVVTEEALLPSSEEEEGGDEDSLPSDHLEGSDTESQKDDTETDATEGLRFRSFRADRAGSDTGEEEAPSPAWPPMPTSPLRRQVGVTLSPVHGGIAGAVADHIELVEAGPVVTGGDVAVPVWLFLAVIAVMLVYLTMVAYVMSWQCGVRR
jgi:hypothetical protein